MLVIPVFLGVSVLVFVIMAMTPGDPVLIRLGFNPNVSPQQVELIRAQLGLDKPIYIQYFSYLNLLLHGNFGYDVNTGQPVIQEIAQAYPNTLILAAASMVVSLGVGIPIGVYSATKQYSVFDRIATIGSLTAAAVPNFWLALILILVFSFWLKLLPSFGVSGPESLILPALTLGLTTSAIVVRFTRSSMLEVIRQDYVRTARAKGLRERTIVTRHMLKNALIPIITVVGIIFGTMLAGAFFVEYVFAYPGIGRLAVDAIQQKNYPLVQGIVFIVSVTFVMLNLLVDIIYVYLDPRVRME